MNFLGKLENSLKPKEEKKKKLYGEADIDGFDASIFNLPEDMQTDVAEVQAETATSNLDDIPEEPEETNYDDLPEPETPAIMTNFPRGIFTFTFAKLFTLAPFTSI